MPDRSNRNHGRKNKEAVKRRNPDDTDTISRLTRQFRSREHMSYATQSHPGDEELVRHLRVPFKEIVLNTESR